MPKQIGDNRRAGAALWQRVVMAGNLSDDRRNLGRKLEIAIRNEKASYAAKIDGAEEVFQIDIKYETLISVNIGVGDYGISGPEAVR